MLWNRTFRDKRSRFFAGRMPFPPTVSKQFTCLVSLAPTKWLPEKLTSHFLKWVCLVVVLLFSIHVVTASSSGVICSSMSTQCLCERNEHLTCRTDVIDLRSLIWLSIVISRVLQSVPAIWLCHRLLRGVDSVHFPILLMGMCRQCGRWSGENPFVQVSTTWVGLDLSGNGSSDTVYDEGDWNLAVG